MGVLDLMNKRTYLKALAAVFCFWLAVPAEFVFSAPQDFTSQSLAVPAGATQTESSKPKDLEIEKLPDGKFYLNFKGAALINVLNVLSELSGINFVAGKEIADRQVNMTLDKVTLEDVLESISKGSNVAYDFLPGRNIYLFRAGADAADRPSLVTKVIKLFYIRASEIKEIESGVSSSGGGDASTTGSTSSGSSNSGGLTTMSSSSSSSGGSGDSDSVAIVKIIEEILSERGKVSVDDRSNSLVVTDSEDRVRMVEEAIAKLDRPLDQVLINVLLVETFEDLTRNLGVTWGDTNGIFGTVTGSVSDTPWPLRPGASPNRSSNLSSIFGGFGDAAKDTVKQFSPTNNSGAITTQGVRDFSSFQVQVQALESASKLKILAKPKILVLDNEPAIVKISTNAAIGVTTSSESGTGTTVTQNIERAEVGTILRVTPLINTGDRITMTLEPTFATVDNSSITTSAGASGDPTVRTARTTMMVNDGQTAALGGLLMSNQSNGNRKVPFFGNIPVVGKALFTNNSKSLQDRELILFVTPYIIRSPSALETPTVPDKRLRYDDEAAPFWKVKQKEWYRKVQQKEPEKPIDFDGYFNVRRKTMDSVLEDLDKKNSPGKGQ